MVTNGVPCRTNNSGVMMGSSSNGGVNYLRFQLRTAKISRTIRLFFLVFRRGRRPRRPRRCFFGASE
jgi:hypothetical protein